MFTITILTISLVCSDNINSSCTEYTQVPALMDVHYETLHECQLAETMNYPYIKVIKPCRPKE